MNLSPTRGGGFFFHLLHCDRCGAEKRVSLEEIGEAHIRFVKGLKVPYSSVTMEMDRKIQEEYPGEPILKQEYHEEIEEIAGMCACGGSFSMSAQPRCPECRGGELMKDDRGVEIDYD